MFCVGGDAKWPRAISGSRLRNFPISNPSLSPPFEVVAQVVSSLNPSLGVENSQNVCLPQGEFSVSFILFSMSLQCSQLALRY